MLILGGIDIGNRRDISPRVIDAIKTSDVIVVENISMFKKLCQDLKVTTDSVIIEYYAPMPKELEDRVVSNILDIMTTTNKDILILSDDGMPGMSDPGGMIVNLAHQVGVRVTVIPGPSIVSTLPAVTGMNGTEFVYDDDLPEDKEGRARKFQRARDDGRGYMFIVKNRRDHNSQFLSILNEIKDIMGNDRKIGIGINLTMPDEMVIVDSIDGAIQRVSEIDLNQRYFISVYIQEP